MKKISILSLILIMIVPFVFAEENDIRKLKWGMSYDDVKKIEGLEDRLYKEEDLLGMKVEIVFGCSNKGLYSVIYSSSINPDFFGKVYAVLEKKYGEPKEDLDYSFLIQSKEILMNHPVAVVDILYKNDYSELNQIAASYSNVNERKIIKGGLTKRKIWEYGNTVALLLFNAAGGVLSYRPKEHHYANKKKFDLLMKELKKEAEKKKKVSKADDNF